MKVVRLSELTTFPPAKELTPEELAEAYRLLKAAFTAEDLQRYTEIEEGVSAEEFLAELEEIQKQHDQRSQ